MTLKNQKNHYNVKFLKGYGHSISVKDSKIILKSNHDPFSPPEQEEWFVKNMPYEKIVLSGKGYVSTEALSLLSENNRNVILLDNHGKPVTFCNGMMDSLTATKYRMAQYDTFRNPEKCEYLRKQIISAKKESQLKLLRLIGSEISELPDSEHISAKVYWTEFAKFIPEKYQFHSRNQSHITSSKNNATDIINALLNYGYSVLAGEISKFVCGFGLDPYLGFMHRSHTGFQPLVYDIIEPFRWLVDYTVYSMANHSSTRQRIKLKEYSFTKDGTVVLEYSLIKRFLEMLERQFSQERKYSFRHGKKTKDGLKSVQEITVVKIIIQNLVEYSTGKQKSLESNNFAFFDF
ncbi:CRISPR-associated Cas1 family protein [Candidatus Nitrosopumilus koreensis AR1]|uniref:CRISPR-associated endonuclease Cas1 n=1 Tax=Candidatus Nitrosopumilus koreensis AR1 TaxID=1229908 RepID=K0B3J1_9ARCH|nr:MULTISPECIES: CRISPR-associated endonuclease Cas1 [Nitrosopumilus]AFS80663.1 CRISPR-associated Cas1 family protein [Candidatus Nitrosopumilus koreensis AR1]